MIKVVHIYKENDFKTFDHGIITRPTQHGGEQRGK